MYIQFCTVVMRDGIHHIRQTAEAGMVNSLFGKGSGAYPGFEGKIISPALNRVLHHKPAYAGIGQYFPEHHPVLLHINHNTINYQCAPIFEKYGGGRVFTGLGKLHAYNNSR